MRNVQWICRWDSIEWSWSSEHHSSEYRLADVIYRLAEPVYHPFCCILSCCMSSFHCRYSYILCIFKAQKTFLSPRFVNFSSNCSKSRKSKAVYLFKIVQLPIANCQFLPENCPISSSNGPISSGKIAQFIVTVRDQRMIQFAARLTMEMLQFDTIKTSTRWTHLNHFERPNCGQIERLDREKVLQFD